MTNNTTIVTKPKLIKAPAPPPLDLDRDYWLDLIASRKLICIKLINGTAIEGRVRRFSKFSLLIERDSHGEIEEMFLPKHSVLFITKGLKQ